MRLTKNIREKILRQNKGFITQTSYDSRNRSYDRTYKVQDGKVHIKETGKTSWADSHYKKEWIADEEETHSFLYKNKEDMNLDGLE